MFDTVLTTTAAPRLIDGEPGRGTLEKPDVYWATNGYPSNISFAYQAGELGLEGRVDLYNLTIGVVNANETSRQEIIDLLSPNYYVTVIDCTYSYQQREAVFNEISASQDANVRLIQMSPNTELVLVEVANGYEEEYARKYSEQYGALVLVVNFAWDTNASVQITPTVTRPSAVELYPTGPEVLAPAPGWAISSIDEEIHPPSLAPAFPPPVKSLPGNNGPASYWPWLVGLIVLIGAATVVYFNRAHLMPAMQTNTGHIVTGNVPASRKQTIAAVKNSALTPPDSSFNVIMIKVDAKKHNPEQSQ